MAKFEKQKAWDWESARYADLTHPEWLDRVPRGFWNDRENERRYIVWLGRKLNIRKLDDWYQVSGNDFTENRGCGLLCKYDDSPIQFLYSLFPYHDWKTWLFKFVPQGYWKQQENRVQYIHWLASELGYSNPEDWYQVTAKAIAKHHGPSVMKLFDHDLLAVLRDAYPEMDWLPWRFQLTTTVLGKRSNCFWSQRKNRVWYMTWLGTELGFQKWEDWYSITNYDYEDNYGGSLLQYASGSPSRVVMETFREHKWLPWLFHKTIRGFWETRSNRIRYMNWLGKELGFRSKGDWYQLRGRHFHEHYGKELWIGHYNYCALTALRDYRPHFNWDPALVSKKKKITK